MVLYLSAIAIIAGIDKEKREIEKSVLYYALGILITYIIYLCIIDKPSIYRYVMYLSTLVILLVADTIKLKSKAKTSYVISILILLVIMAVFTGEVTTILTIIMTLLIIAIYILISKIKNITNKVKKEEKDLTNNLTLGFYLCISNIIMLTYVMFTL